MGESGDAKELWEAIAALRTDLLRSAGRWIRRSGARAIDPEDLVQETLVAAWRRLPDLAGYDLSSLQLRSWLERTLRHAALNARRKEKHRGLSTAGVVKLERSGSDFASDSVLQNELRATLAAALRSLDAEERRTVLLVDFHGLTFAEAAHRLELAGPWSARRVRLRALEKMQQALKRRLEMRE